MKKNYIHALFALAASFYNRIKGKVSSRFVSKEHYTTTPQRTQKRLGEHDLARKHGISKAFRQYAKRYGNLDVSGILQVHRQAKR